MASATSRTSSGPPFPLNKLTTAPWREHALTKIGEQRFLLEWISNAPDAPPISDEIRQTIHDHAASASRRSSSTGTPS